MAKEDENENTDLESVMKDVSTESDEEKDDGVDDVSDYRDGISTDDEIREAMQRGWDPNHDDPNKPYRTAHDYLVLEPFYQEIHKLKKESRQTKEAFKKFQEHAEKTAEREYNRAIEDLKSKKKQALEDDDHDRVVEIDEEMKKAEKEYQAETPKQDTNDAFEDFKQRNPWYESDPELQGVADGVGMQYARQNPDMPIEEIYEKVEGRIKELFPDRFGSKKTAPQVEGSEKSASKRAGSKKKRSVKDLGLSREEESVIYNMLEMTGMSEDEYIKNMELESK